MDLDFAHSLLSANDHDQLQEMIWQNMDTFWGGDGQAAFDQLDSETEEEGPANDNASEQEQSDNANETATDNETAEENANENSQVVEMRESARQEANTRQWGNPRQSHGARSGGW